MKRRLTFTRLLIITVIVLVSLGAYIVGQTVDFEEVLNPAQLVEVLR